MEFLEKLGIKKTQNTTQQPSASVVDQVLQMRSQGLSDNQIIQNLQRSGVDQTSIYNAFNLADIKKGVTSTPLPGETMTDQPPPLPSFEGPPKPQEFSPTPTMGSESISMREHVSEVAEAIIEEKWNELVNSVGKIAEWKDRVEGRVQRLEDNFVILKADFDKLHQALLAKINDYDESVKEVGSNIKAMEKVFTKVLPTLTDNVSELSRITDNMKKP
ncbi:hypothetical protein GOV04_01965 [Candidatus Woesearchaeota archaeon]|nr:hypothetical protein [Candidatus Woesearchaeota archaeon]